MAVDPNDGGYKSRKLHMAYVVMFLMTCGFIATAKFPTLVPAYGEFCFGLIGAASIFAGSNVMVKWAAAKNAAPATSTKKTALVSETKAVDNPDEEESK